MLGVLFPSRPVGARAALSVPYPIIFVSFRYDFVVFRQAEVANPERLQARGTEGSGAGSGDRVAQAPRNTTGTGQRRRAGNCGTSFFGRLWLRGHVTSHIVLRDGFFRSC